MFCYSTAIDKTDIKKVTYFFFDHINTFIIYEISSNHIPQNLQKVIKYVYYIINDSF